MTSVGAVGSSQHLSSPWHWAPIGFGQAKNSRPLFGPSLLTTLNIFGIPHIGEVPRFLLRPSSITFNPVHIFLYAVLDVSIKDGETFDLLHLPIHLLRGNNLEDAAELRQSAVLLRVHLLQLGSQLQALVSKSSSTSFCFQVEDPICWYHLRALVRVKGPLRALLLRIHESDQAGWANGVETGPGSRYPPNFIKVLLLVLSLCFSP